MSDWNSLPLGTLVSFQKGKKVDTSSYLLPGYRRYLGANSLDGSKKVYASTYLAVQANTNDILMLWDGERSGLVGHGLEGVVSSTVSKLSLRNEIESNYLYYFLLNKFEWIQNKRTGTGIPHVPKDLGRILSVYYPIEKNYQQKVSLIIGTMDLTIKKTEALIEKYQQIKTGLMHDLFTRGLGADGKLRPTREQEPELYHKTDIGWIPKDWALSHLKTMSKNGVQHLRTGPFGSALKGEHWVEEGHPVITIGSLGEGEFNESELLYIGDKDASRLRDFRLKLGDVVFSRVADVGRSIVIKKEQVGWIMSSNLMRISLDPDKIMPEFLQYQLSSNSVIKKQIRCKVNSGGRDVANSDILNSLWFFQPDPNEQLAIVKRAEKIDSRLKAEQSLAHKLSLQKLGLMNDLLTGKMPVSVDEPEAAHV